MVKMLSFSGKITKIFTKKEYKDFHVILVKNEENETIALSGQMIEPKLNVYYDFEYEQIESKKYKVINKIIRYSLKKDTKESIASYLINKTEGLITTKKAKEIIKLFGLNCIMIIKEKPEVLKVFSFTDEEIEKIADKFYFEEEEIINRLTNFGLSNIEAKKLVNAIKNNVIDKFLENPYIAYDAISYMSFKRIDEIAINLGIEKDHKGRIKVAINYILEEEVNKTGSTRIQLLSLIDKLIMLLEIDNTKRIEETIEELVKESLLYLKNETVSLPKYFKLEEDIAYYLKQLDSKREEFEDREKILEIINNIQEEIEYTEEQKEAILTAVMNNVILITGGPGTGKSTIIDGIIKTLFQLNINEDDIKLLAPTARAAKRMTETTGYEASTIHRELKILIESKTRYEEDKIKAKVVIIDEVSMLDIEIAKILLESLDKDTKVIFIGDKDQLPSVGPGAFIEDLLLSNKIKVVKLTKIMRQASESRIIQLSQMILNGKIEDEILNNEKQVFFFNIQKENLWQQIKRYLDRIYELDKTLNDTQILIPMYKTQYGIDEINRLYQSEYNKNSPIKAVIHNRSFYVGDRVMQTKNNMELGIINGEVGFIIDIDTENKKVKIEFEDIIEVNYDQMEDITLACAISVHKSQGSEYKNVIIPIFSVYSFILSKRLLYTAVTRAKQKCILCGEYWMLNQIATKTITKRETNLLDLLKDTNTCKDIAFPNIVENFNITLDDCEKLEIEEIKKRYS